MSDNWVRGHYGDDSEAEEELLEQRAERYAELHPDGPPAESEHPGHGGLLGRLWAAISGRGRT